MNRIANVKQLVNLVKSRKDITFEGLCDHFSINPKKCRSLLDEARRQKFAVDVSGEHVGLRPAEPNDEVVDVKVSRAGNPHIFAVASDIHVGSKYHMRAQFLDFIHLAYDRGVRRILLPGDDLDGCYDHGRWELTHHGFQDQIAEFESELPQLKDLEYFGISGNHDETFEKKSGLVVHRAMQDFFRAKGRHDLHMLGARGAYLRLRAPYEKRGIVVHLWHPIKGPAYALTYGMQKQIEKYAPGAKPDILLTGHWHQSCYFVSRGVHALSCGTFQGGGGSYGRALGGAPSIGGWIIEYATTPEGTVRHVKPEWVGYFEKEVVRDVAIC